MSAPGIITAVSTANMASETAASLILPTSLGLPTTLVAAGTALTSFSTASMIASAAAAAATSAAVSAAPSGGTGGKRVLTPEQKIVMAYRSKWNGKFVFETQAWSFLPCLTGGAFRFVTSVDTVERMPVIFLTICAVLFGLWFLAEQPRFIVRLFSSPMGKIRRSRSRDEPVTDSGSQPGPTGASGLKRKRTVGGELWSGWVLKKGEVPDLKPKVNATLNQYPPVQIIRTPADAMDDPAIRRPAPAAHSQQLTPPRFLSAEEKHRLSTIEDLCEETPSLNNKEGDDDFLLPAISHAAPIYYSHRRNDSRPNLGRIITDVSAGNRTMPDHRMQGGEGRVLTRHNSLTSAAESIYSQETTCVGHESLDGHEDKFTYLKKTHLLGSSPHMLSAGGQTPPSALASALTSATLLGSGPASALLSSCSEAPLLSATASPRFGEGLNRRTIANEAALHQLSPPPYMPSVFDRIPGIQKLLLCEVAPRLTCLDLFVYSLYAGIVAFANFYKNTDWEWSAKKNPLGPDLLRAGAISMAQVPLVIGLGGRNSPIRYLLGGGQSRAVINIHKFSGRACFACMLLHVVGYGESHLRVQHQSGVLQSGLMLCGDPSSFIGYKWGKSGIFLSKVKEPAFVWGMTAAAGLTFMVVTSIPVVRRRLYSVFMISHVIGLVGFLLGLGMHVPEAVPYVLAGAGLYGVELLCRILKTKMATAELRVLPGTDSILVSVPSIKTGWRAGQHVILRVPALVSHRRYLCASMKFSFYPLFSRRERACNSSKVMHSRLPVLRTLPPG
jgi:hypothetical protein